ncbi:MAG: hypothetical protein L0Y56_01240 [Nitrospira sp.]|nr:hypothetical protein [Nitrospira sp.]
MTINLHFFKPSMSVQEKRLARNVEPKKIIAFSLPLPRREAKRMACPLQQVAAVGLEVVDAIKC